MEPRLDDQNPEPRVRRRPRSRVIIALVLIAALLAVRLGCRMFDPPVEQPSTQPASNEALPAEIWARLRAAGWQERAGDTLALWVSVARQRLIGVKAGRVEFIYTCSTAARGTGNREGSNQTPLGWHEIAERIGEGLPEGAILVERKYTGRVWSGQTPTEKDYVLTRILWLRGLEPGVNSGPGIDSHDRFIYIHGTPAEDRLGTPASMGCVRVSNADVIALFDRVPVGTRVLLTDW